MRTAFETHSGLLAITAIALAPWGVPPAWAQGTPAPPAAVQVPLSGAARWTGDLDGMQKRRRIRALVAYSKTGYFVEKGVPRGISY